MFTFFFLYSIFNSERTFFFTSRLITSYIDLRSVIHLSLSSALCHQTTPIFFLLAPFHLLELFLRHPLMPTGCPIKLLSYVRILQMELAEKE